MAKTQILAGMICFIVVAVSLAASAPASDKQSESIPKNSDTSSEIKPATPIDNSVQHSDNDSTDKKGLKLNPKKVKDKDFYIQAMMHGYQSRPYPMMPAFNNFPYEHAGYGPPMQGGGYGPPMQGGSFGFGYDSMGGYNTMHSRNNEYGNSNWY